MGTSKNISTESSKSLGAFSKEHSKEQELRRQNLSLLRQLDKARNKTAELQEVFYRACQEAASALSIPKVPLSPLPKKRTTHPASEEKAIIVVSDMQLGKVTPTYNSAVCEERMERYATKAALLTDIQRHHHPVREARMYWLGDMIEGENIFPGQAHQIDAGMFTQIMIDGPRILVNFTRSLLTVFDRIHISCVPGNHGRIGTRNQGYNPETNSDRMLYYMAHALLKDEPRVTWDIAYERNESGWYTVDYPFGDKGRGILLFHGHQIKGWSGFPFYGTSKKVMGWAAGALPESAQAGGRGFHYAMFGHYHTATRLTLSNMRAWCNGCFVAGTLVLTKTRPQPIEAIQPGEETLGIDGRFHRVERTWQYESDEGTVSLGVKGLPYEIEVTPNHEVYAMKGDSVGCAFKRHRLAILENSVERPQWIPAEMLSPGDWVSIPAPHGTLEPIDEDLAWVYGLYLAERHALIAGGSSKSKTHHRIQFDMHLKEAETHLARAKAVLDRVFGKEGAVYLHPDRNTSTLYYSGREIAERWRSRFGHRAEGKHIDPVMLEWSPRLQRMIVEGWIAGDGHIRHWKPGITPTKSAVTVSEQLAWGMFQLARGAGMFPFLTRIHKAGKLTGSGGRVQKDIFEVNFTGGQDVRTVEGLAFYRVCHRRRKNQHVPVFDLQTTDHTYIAAGIGVHNSTESTNTFAQETLASQGDPEQLLVFMRPNRVTAEYWVDLLND